MSTTYTGPSHQDVCRKRLGLGTCDCCGVCGDHRWNFDKTKCLSATCWPRELRPTHKSKSRSKPKEVIVLPAWLRTKPRTVRGKREAAIYARSTGLELPWEGWEKWEEGE